MRTNFANKLLAQSRLGSLGASAWENHDSQTGSSLGVSISLTKSFFNKKTGGFDKRSCSFSLAEVAAAIEVLRDIQAQMLVRSREFRRQDSDADTNEDSAAQEAF